MSENVKELDDDTFNEGIAKGIALVEFYGTWCPPCKLLEPVLQELAERFAGQIQFAKINVDECSESAVEQSIADIPTLVFYQDGVEVRRLYGAQSVETLQEVLNILLAGNK